MNHPAVPLLSGPFLMTAATWVTPTLGLDSSWTLEMRRTGAWGLWRTSGLSSGRCRAEGGKGRESWHPDRKTWEQNISGILTFIEFYLKEFSWEVETNSIWNILCKNSLHWRLNIKSNKVGLVWNIFQVLSEVFSLKAVAMAATRPAALQASLQKFVVSCTKFVQIIS